MAKFISDINNVSDLNNKKLSPGDSVVIKNRNYNNFNRGNSYKFINYLDGDTSKIILEGTTPGGWVDSINIETAYCYDNLRMITISELFETERFSILVGDGIPVLAGISILGEPVKCVKTNIHNQFTPLCLAVGYYFPIWFLTRKPHPSNISKLLVKMPKSNSPQAKIFANNGVDLKLMGTTIYEIEGYNECLKLITEIFKQCHGILKQKRYSLMSFPLELYDYEIIYENEIKQEKIEKDISNKHHTNNRGIVEELYNSTKSIQQDGVESAILPGTTGGIF